MIFLKQTWNLHPASPAGRDRFVERVHLAGVDQFGRLRVSFAAIV